MADELEQKPEEEQNKREQAKRDLADLQKLMAQVQGSSSEDSGEQPEPNAQAAASVDELIDRAAAEAEGQAEPEETASEPAAQTQQETDAPSQIDEPRSEEPETPETPAEPAEEAAPEPSETPEEEQQAEREQAQREAVLDRQKRRREAAQAAAGTPVEPKKRKKKSSKKQQQTPHKTHKDAKLARKRRRQLIRMGTVLVVVLVALVLIVSIVRGIAGSGKKDTNTDNKKATTTAVSDTQKEKDTSTPASQQESKQYLKIKDDTSLPDYAKEYPGLYATAATTPKKLSDKKVCYLTFDDGPSDTCTPQVLDILKKYNVKATFFVVASEIDGNEKLIQRIIDEGHTLCIHANEHDYQKIYASPEAYLKDFAAAYDKIYALTGYKVQGFRFPGGSNGQLKHYGNYDAIIKEMNRRGFEYYDWNAYDHDAEGGNYSASQLAQYAVHEVSISSRNDVIVLMHDTYGKENTVKALPSIIEGIQKQGIELLPITKTTRPVHFSVDENTPAEYTEETSSKSEDSAKSSDSSSSQSSKSSSAKSETKN